MDIEALKQQLVRHEGLRLRPYTCTAGYNTIGVGHNLDTKPISERAAMIILEDDINDAMQDLDRNLPWWRTLPDPARGALLDMCFNLGISRLLGFKRMLAALERGDYVGAALEALGSRS